MIIKCNTLGKEFSSKEEMFKELKANEAHIIKLKKASIQKSFEKGQFAPSNCISKLDESTKSTLEIDPEYIYPVINTTKYLDSHDDVHFDGIWNRSMKDQKGRIHYTTDHELKVGNIIAWPEDVEVFTKTIPWALVGKNFQGETEALIFKIKRTSLKNRDATEAINEQRKLQNSVRMRYYIIKFAIDSDDREYAENKAYYDANINKIANREKAEEQGYFFGVEEAAIVDEGSLVIRASNDATAIITAETKLDSSSSHSSKLDSGSSHTEKAEAEKKEFLSKMNLKN